MEITITIKKFVLRVWNSATCMTWGSFFTRSISFVVVLPLLLRKLGAGEIVVWYLFMTINTLRWLMDMGFSSTSSRAISYAMGGATHVRGFRDGNSQWGDGRPNWLLLESIVSNTRTIYTLLALATFLVVGVFGTMALLKPISVVSGPFNVWLAWMLIVINCPVTMLTNVYELYLEGTNQIALVRRWDMFTSLGTIASFIIALLLGGGILSLVAVNQGWGLFRIIRNRTLCRHVEGGRFKTFKKQNFNKEIFNSLWPSTWRSGIGGVMSYGIVSASSLLIAQFGNTAQTASYLLAMKFIDTLVQFSQAPFYSKLPLLARKRAEGDIAGLTMIAQKGMTIAYWAFLSGFLFLGFFAHPLLKLVRSNASFASPDLWMLLGLAFFVHRYGAMHIQLYSTTNHIIWHIADTVAGTIAIVAILTLVKFLGVYAFPLGFLCGYVGFYSWFAAGYSYRAMKTSFYEFERRAFIPPMIIMLAYAGFVLWSKLIGGGIWTR